MFCGVRRARVLSLKLVLPRRGGLRISGGFYVAGVLMASFLGGPGGVVVYGIVGVSWYCRVRGYFRGRPVAELACAICRHGVLSLVRKWAPLHGWGAVACGAGCRRSRVLAPDRVGVALA